MGVLIGRSPHQKQSWMSASAVWEGSLNSILGKGGGGGWRGCLPGLVRRQHTSQCCSGSAAEISGQVEGTEHLSNTSFPHLHPGQIDWKCSVSGPELDLSYGRRLFFFQVLLSATQRKQSAGSAPVHSVLAAASRWAPRWPATVLSLN